MLSSLFDVSLDILIKGDLEEMKEKIEMESIERFKKEGNVFNILMVSMILLPVLLARLLGYIGIGIWAVIAMITIYYAIRVEKLKKKFEIQTYKEILAFCEGKNIDEIEKNREYGKGPYQKILLAVGAGLMTLVIALIMGNYLS